jgi:hypothetical protein
MDYAVKDLANHLLEKCARRAETAALAFAEFLDRLEKHLGI